MARGQLTSTFRTNHVRTRSACYRDEARPWHACPPTHVPWTSGALDGPSPDLTIKWQMGGGWGHLVIGRLDDSLDETKG